MRFGVLDAGASLEGLAMAHESPPRNGANVRNATPGQGGAPDGIGTLPHLFTRWAGSRWTSMFVATAVVVILLVGVFTGFPHGWQTSVHTAGALVSLLMLFLLQHTTNRETKAILVKLDELIQASSGAREEVMNIEEHEVEDQEELHRELHHRAARRTTTTT
jgi:low affinity Fe/Cu permease